MTAVPSDLWVSMTSLGGVVLGGGLSFWVQRATQRSAERAEERRQVLALTEGRRAERLAQVQSFVEVTAEAERCAFIRPATWSAGDEWEVRTQEVMNRVWVAERMVRLMFPLPVYAAARAYFLDLNRAVWEGLPDGESLRDYLEDNRLAFLDAARAAVDGPPAPPGRSVRRGEHP
ncbi:hypothetical protein [Micromonospora endolithica]|uniref:DUF4760 domain-containing protein n=1 Tax=Micromonospora endolithica TaxID=230091 RepID=A0A3A9ZBP7_9ACTN|nr:hypothetical protein [Micromonospora endolithica]RKN45529.1 hypothetical protein D7223_17525 [Micromonospora endolithica]TWJ22882.1 hypothetical protein JD76_03005 [Micromonospora endolithica]